MDHARFKANHTAALYVSGDLEERVQESFELHLMACAKCVEDVEIWRAMHAGLRNEERAGAAGALARPQHMAVWRIAASLALVAIGSGAAGWYGRSFTAHPLTDDAVAVFNLPPLTRGYEDCEQLRVGPATEIVALRVPNAAAGWHLEVTDAEGTPLASGAYSVRTQADGSWLLRMRARPLANDLLRLQTRATDGATEPVGCLVIAGTS